MHKLKQKAYKIAKEIYDNLLDSNEYEKIFFPTEETYDDGIILRHIPCGTIIKKIIRRFNEQFKYFQHVSCSNKECTQKRKKETCFKNWGVSNPLQSEEVKEKKKQTTLEKYGVEHSAQSNEIQKKAKKTWNNKSKKEIDEIKEKKKQTTLEKYGVEYSIQSKKVKEKRKQTCMEKYGVEHSFQSREIEKKIKKTNLERYGTENPSQSEEIKEKIKQTCLDKYGVEHSFQSEEVKKKGYNTKKKNNSFHTSKPEEEFYSTLCTIYGRENVIKQYKEERYPFNCDFYIKNFDFFIELNKWPGHGKEPYNPNNKKHQNILEEWKSKTNGNDMYKYMIEIWTKSDPEKRKIAKENKLNYLEVF